MIAMKKTVSVLALLICLLLLTGCGAQAFLHDVAEQLHNANAAEEAENDAVFYDASDTDADYDAVADDPLAGGHAEGREEDEYEDASLTDAAEAPQAPEETPEELPPAGFAALSLEECVADAEGSQGKLPRVTLDCPGAAYINDDIQGTFGYLVDADYCTMYYTASKDGDILSLLIVQLYDDDASYFTPYLLDLSTGEHISGRELLARMGVTPEEVALEELQLMDQEFQHLYGTEGDGFYEEQHDRTVSLENADTDRLWLENGALRFVARIYALAGAEFYEYPMSAGYFYG